jgi:hypothetical protein
MDVLAVGELGGVLHILRVDDAVISMPDELLRTDLLVFVLLCRPSEREGASNQSFATTNLDSHLFGVESRNVICPAFAGSETSAGGVPLVCNDGRA